MARLATDVGLLSIAAVMVVMLSPVVTSTAETTEPPPLPRPDHKSALDSGMVALYDMTNFFLEDMVQLGRYLTWLEEKKGVDLSTSDSVKDSLENDYWYWVEYWVGFTICGVVGVLAIIIMPIVGISVACCRCCGNCGGKTDPREEKNTTCKRVCCGVTLVVVTCFLLSGAVLMFVINDVMRSRMQGDETVFDDISRGLHDVDVYLDSTVGDLNHTVLGGYVEVKDEVFVTLDNIPTDAVLALDDATGVVTTFHEMEEFFEQGLPDLNTSLSSADSLLVQLRVITADLEPELETVKVDILASILGCTEPSCDEARQVVLDLALGTDFTAINVDLSLAAIQLALQYDWSLELQKIADELRAIEELVNSTVYKYTEDAKRVAEDVEKEIEHFIDDIENSLDSIDFDGAAESLDDAKDSVDYPWDIVYWSVVGLGTIVLVIVLCNLVGVIYGSFCPPPQTNTKGCDQVMGADWLLAGIGFTFIFYWLFMMIVLVIFIAGGIVHTEVCRNVVEYENPQSREVLAYVESWVNDTVYEETDGDLSVMVVELYENCQRNMSFYAALDLAEKGWDLDEILDLTMIEEAIEELKVAAMDIDIGPVDVYPPALETAIGELDTIFESELNFDAFYEELDKGITNTDLEDLATDLEKLIGEPGVINNTLEAGIQTLRNLTVSHVEPAEDLADQLEVELRTSDKILNETALSEINKTMAEANVIINTQGNDIVQKFINDTADEVFFAIDDFVDEIDEWVRYYLGNCWPMYESLTFMVDTSCVTTLYPLNAFWFSLGMVVFFLIISIIVAYELVTQYRKTIPWSFSNSSGMETDPLYNSNKTEDYYAFDHQPRGMVLTDMDNSQAMGGADNPIYVQDDFQIPRPKVYAAATPYAAAGYPASAHPEEKKHSPPPSYQASVWDGREDAYSTKL